MYYIDKTRVGSYYIHGPNGNDSVLRESNPDKIRIKHMREEILNQRIFTYYVKENIYEETCLTGTGIAACSQYFHMCICNV